MHLFVCVGIAVIEIFREYHHKINLKVNETIRFQMELFLMSQSDWIWGRLWRAGYAHTLGLVGQF